jgi:hypothetical protein
MWVNVSSHKRPYTSRIISYLFLTRQLQECPTLWRIYEFVTDQDRDAILRAREEKRDLTFGRGGEGYIGQDDWCYNCGDCGHLGDVSFRSVR